MVPEHQQLALHGLKDVRVVSRGTRTRLAPCCLAAGDGRGELGSRPPGGRGPLVRSLITTVGLDMTTDEDTAERPLQAKMLSQDACLGLSRWGTTVAPEIFGNVVGERDFHDPSCTSTSTSSRRAAKTQQHREREREREAGGGGGDGSGGYREGRTDHERGNQEGNHTTLLVADEIGQVKGE